MSVDAYGEHFRGERAQALERELREAKADFADRMHKALLVNEDRLDEIGSLRAALLVITCTPSIRKWLSENNPKALEQALKALGTCTRCGQGEAGTPGYEHKSSCPFWRDNED